MFICGQLWVVWLTISASCFKLEGLHESFVGVVLQLDGLGCRVGGVGGGIAGSVRESCRKCWAPDFDCLVLSRECGNGSL